MHCTNHRHNLMCIDSRTRDLYMSENIVQTKDKESGQVRDTQTWKIREHLVIWRGLQLIDDPMKQAAKMSHNEKYSLSCYTF